MGGKRPNPKALITEAEKDIIRAYAAVSPEAPTEQKQDLRKKAIEVYYTYLDRYNRAKLPSQDLKASWPDEMAFMSEDANLIPDYTLKRMYRERIVNRGL